MILDFLLPRETKNLIKINKLGKEFNNFLDKGYLKNIEEKFKKIKTEEHKDKIKFYLELINLCKKSPLQFSEKQQ